MSKILIHGDDLVRSRQQYFTLLQTTNKTNEVIQLNGEKLTLNELKQALESQSLWHSPKSIFIENLFSRPKSQEQKELHNYIFNYKEKDPNIVIWEKKEIGLAITKKLTAWQVNKYKIPALVFNFLDSLIPGNKQNILSLLHQAQETTPIELIFYMFVRRIRELIVVSELGKEGIKGAPWQINKILFQAKKWDIKTLYLIYQELLKSEFKIKQGKSPLNLAYHLDLLIVNM